MFTIEEVLCQESDGAAIFDDGLDIELLVKLILSLEVSCVVFGHLAAEYLAKTTAPILPEVVQISFFVCIVEHLISNKSGSVSFLVVLLNQRLRGCLNAVGFNSF